MTFDLGDYVDVAERIKIFREKHPDGALQSEITIAPDGSWVLCKAIAYRGPDDTIPGHGHSRLTIPGTTPYTRGSEIENAETSAWGRAIVAALAADTKKVASADEVRAKHADSGATSSPPAARETGAAGNGTDGTAPEPAAPEFVAPTPTAHVPEGWTWPSGKHKGKSLDDTELDYVIWYSENGPRQDTREKCFAFLGGSISDGDSDIPFDRSIDGLGG